MVVMPALQRRVIACLRKVGMAASKSSSTRVRGWHSRSKGYRTMVVSGLLRIRVTFEPDPLRGTRDEISTDTMRQAEQAEQVLLAAGFIVSRETPGQPILVVEGSTGGER